MRKRFFQATLVGVALAAGLALAGCAGQAGTSQDAAEHHVELNIVRNTNNTTSEFTFDPAVQYQGSAAVSLGVCETLFELNDDESDVNGILAEGYSMSDDGLTWTIPIRDDIAFTSGRALDAQVVKESLEYELASLTRLTKMLSIDSISADGQQLTIATKVPVPTLPKILTDSNLLVFDTNEMSDLAHHIVGTGAYVLDNVDGDGNCDMVRNDGYWRGKPIAEAVHSKCGLDGTAVTNALQSGEIDWGTVQSTDVSLLRGAGFNEYTSTSNGRVYYLYLNPNYTFTSDPALRQAIAYAFDRQSIISGLYAGAGEEAYSIFPSYSPYYNDSHDQPRYDANEAKRIMAEAGYVDTDGDGFVERDGQKVSLNITCYSPNSFSKLSEALQSELKDIGIDSNITVSSAIMDDLGAGNYNIGTYAYNTLTYGDALNYLDPVFSTGGNSNFNGFSDAEVDGWLDQLASETDATARAASVQNIQAKVLDSGYYVYLMRPVTSTFVSSDVTSTQDVFNTNKTVGMYLWTIDKAA